MTDRESRERLVALILNAPRKDVVYGDIKLDKPIQTAQTVADHLLANGVILPPCKVGQTVFYVNPHHFDFAFRGKILSYSLDAAHFWFNCHYDDGLNMWHQIEDFGKTVFLTKEEAEAELQKRGVSNAEI